MCNSKYTKVKERANGSLMVWHQGVLSERDYKRLVDGEIRYYHIYEAKFKVQGEWKRNSSTDKSVVERWLNDMRKKYKLQIIGTMLTETYDKLVRDIKKCIENSNYMFKSPMEGYTFPNADGESELIYILGVNDKTIYYKTQDGDELECRTVFMEDTFELRTLARICDEISKHK